MKQEIDNTETLREITEGGLTKVLNDANIIHFNAKEILAPVDSNFNSSMIPLMLIPNIVPTVVIVDNMRKALKFPISINSSYRGWTQNKRVGGGKNSMHLQFNALDIRPTSKSPEELDKMKEWLFSDWVIMIHVKNLIFSYVKYNEKDGKIIERDACYDAYYDTKTLLIDKSKTGIGNYKTFIHLDTRKFLNKWSPARWVGGS